MGMSPLLIVAARLPVPTGVRKAFYVITASM